MSPKMSHFNIQKRKVINDLLLWNKRFRKCIRDQRGGVEFYGFRILDPEIRIWD